MTTAPLSDHQGSFQVRCQHAIIAGAPYEVGRIDGNGLRAFLDRGWATGVSSYSPEHRAGTLWSMVLDVTAGTAAIRFGPPPQDRWHPFSLAGPAGATEYPARFPNHSIQFPSPGGENGSD
jgi:hypothetical protein